MVARRAPMLIDIVPFSEEPREAEAMDRWLDNLHSLLLAIRQRRMTRDQLDRYAGLLGRGQVDALERVKQPRSIA